MIDAFASDIKKTLTGKNKYVKYIYAYDEVGDKLFEDIMQSEEYYISKSETDILNTYKEQFKTLFFKYQRFSLVDLGVGNGVKTEILISYFIQQNVSFQYVPVDFSINAVTSTVESFSLKYPRLQIKAMPYDYFTAISKLNKENFDRKCYLFLGNNIGNLNTKEMILLLKRIQSRLAKNDILYIGFDLVKDINIILKAYDTDLQFSLAFNMLNRINKQFGANFEKENFYFRPYYDQIKSSMIFRAISKKKQVIYIPELKLQVNLAENEVINLGHSQKFTLKEIGQLAKMTGFRIIDNFFDKEQYFVGSIWIKD